MKMQLQGNERWDYVVLQLYFMTCWREKGGIFFYNNHSYELKHEQYYTLFVHSQHLRMCEVQGSLFIKST